MFYRKVLILLFVVTVPQTVWAPSSLATGEVLELPVRIISLYHSQSGGGEGSSIKYGGQEFFTRQKARILVDFMNNELKAKGIRFVLQYREVWDKNAFRIGKNISRRQALALLKPYQKPGFLTFVVPYETPYSTSYLNQDLMSGPVAILNANGGKVAAAKQLGYIFGFSKNCESINSIMYDHCGRQMNQKLNGDHWTYFTNDNMSQDYQQILTIWKLKAQNFLELRNQNRHLASKSSHTQKL